ncbi:MAG TPA: serine hydrolase domain-containing protein [Streptosporangiaceae bacterium]
MSDHARALPDRPNLRHLKLEAKRRLAAGEFATLHEAQLAIAREHGLPSWTALKRRIEATPASPALTQVNWVISRFADAGGPAWAAPDTTELRDHFDDRFLSVVEPPALVRTLTRVAPRLREELVVMHETPVSLRARVGGLQVEAATEPTAPYRLTGLRAYPVGSRVTDARVAAPSTRTDGDVPAEALRVMEESVGELGLPGLVAAGAAHRPGWAAARGSADLERGEELTTGHRVPAYSITKIVTATAVLCLVADGLIGLDTPANTYLREVRLGDDTVTVRELLAHTGGVAGPEELFTEEVPDQARLLGPVVACDGPRGTFAYSNGGYGVLGRLIADVTGVPYTDTATDLVLRPLAMRDSSFPRRWPDAGAVTGYRLADDGAFVPVPRQVCALPAAGGLWSTASDLLRLARTWSTLLPAELADEALRPHAERGPDRAAIGLGWLLNGPKDVYGHAGGGPGACTSLIVRSSTGQAGVAVANRLIPIEPVNARMLVPLG